MDGQRGPGLERAREREIKEEEKEMAGMFTLGFLGLYEEIMSG